MTLNITRLRSQTITLNSRPTEALLEKSIPLDDEYKLQQSIKDESISDKMSEDSSTNNERSDLVEKENMKEIEKGELIPESIDTGTEQE